MNRFLYIAAFGLTGLFWAPGLWAQETLPESDTSGYVLDALDEIYESKSENQDRFDTNIPAPEPVEAQIMKTEPEPPAASEPALAPAPAPAEPLKKIDKTTTPNPYRNHVMQVAKPVAPFTPPLPPRRPDVFYASQSFIQRARNDFHAQSNLAKSKGEPIQQATLTAPAPNPSVITYNPVEVRERDLVKPSVKDILASIDDGKPETETLSTAIFQINDQNTISLGYKPGVTSLSSNIRESLAQKARLKLQEIPDARVEILAYAKSKDGNVQKSGELSLARAEDVRNFLVAAGLDESRINLRPLGNSAPDAQKDRVDIHFVK